MAGLSALLAIPAAWLTGCSLNTDMIAGMGSEVETAPPHGRSTAEAPGPHRATGSNALVVTPRQREYLEALHGVGVTPSSDLSALSIGSYVCQARAAGQDDHAVWDFIVPLVRDDIDDSDGDDSGALQTPSADDVDAATADYIRIATERLC
ncbi:DUF732 domain-containing protein [Mycolicibacterium vaccae]|jgi:hypothetical protein|uniref:DUF732 domain-containing protein n=1 Tax=Mycolicibacterium vaccae ATCC 25954 TaxID=1194972 RepID=K0UMC4_MYCVA|nr:DUF732 domain-containing protein [Mycolicibacterium vaccae]ANI42602.1 hypothetical protein MYVA_5569 [Mycolicibacterium vaccae 95051]EJZ06195.1 hypothetical protein MVAC_22795 [Mycolicibacterium vaccae ATCC 25954]MCV7059722.1 DUF732 domain-containing protein [Mycolicibacterium vaccae]